MHLIHPLPPPPPPPKLKKNFFFFLLVITAVPREIENNTYAKFGGGQIRCHMENVEMVNGGKNGGYTN